MREVVLDTETTGLDHGSGDRVVEIGCVELLNTVPTGRTFHKYLNPQRYMPSTAQAVHGLTDEFLRDKPLFVDVCEELLTFLDGARVIAHNAEFDIGFLNAELARVERPPLACEVIDTVRLARRKYPGAPASLDALCDRFRIDRSARDNHGALLDARLLADVYLELSGGRQPALALAVQATVAALSAIAQRAPRPARPHQASPDELAAHQAFLAALREPLWLAA
jgi:DNA polymerase-3 subunit epsilon